MNKLAGNAFNIGGGSANSISLLELLDLLAELHGGELSVRFEDWRAADQRYYVADTGKFSGLTGWQPRVGVHEGVRRLYEWSKNGGVVENSNDLVVSTRGTGSCSSHLRAGQNRFADA